MSSRSGPSKAQQQATVDVQVRELRDHVHGRDVQISTLKQHLALLTSDFKYNLKLLEDRDFELDQCEAQLAQSEKLTTLKVKEIDLLVAEIANLKSIADRDAAQIQELEVTLSQYKESVRSVRERLEEALQLRDQELTCHRSELEALQTKLLQQTESLKVHEKGLGDAMKACERTWSQRYSECHKTVLTLVAEQSVLLKEKLEKVLPLQLNQMRLLEGKEMESLQDRALGLQKALDELTQVADTRRKECASLTDQLETVKGRLTGRLEELEHEKQELEVDLRKKILEEYDGKIAELLAQLQSIEYAVSLERREAHTRSISMEAQHAEQISVLHQTVQDLRRERDVSLDKVAKLERDLSSLKGSLIQIKAHETRLSEREASLTEEVSNLQDSLHEAQTLLEKSEEEKTHEISLLHEFLREAGAKENVFSKKEGELVKRMYSLEKSLDEARSKVETLSKRESEQTKELIALQEPLTEAKSQKDAFSKKNAEYVKELAALKKSLLEARNQADMFSRKHAESIEDLTNLQQSLIEARNRGDMVEQNNDEHTKDIADLKHILREARTQEELMRRKLDGQAKEMVDLREQFCTAKAEGELDLDMVCRLLKAEAAHAEEICVLRTSLVETQKQADAARSHAKHLDAILEVTQAEARRRVEIKESVSCLITEAQDLHDFDMRQDSTTLEYSSAHRLPDSYSGAEGHGRIVSPKKTLPRNDARGFEHGFIVEDHQDLGHATDTNIQTLMESDEEPQTVLEEENRFLKARVEELHAENLKVGVVISDLRHELETVGLLQRPEVQPPALSSKTSGKGKAIDHVKDGPSVSSLKQNTCSKSITGTEKVKRPSVGPLPEQEAMSLAEKEELQMLHAMMKDVNQRNAHFYGQVESMDTKEKFPQKPFSDNKATCPHQVASDGGEFHEEPCKPHQQLLNEDTNIPFDKAGISHRIAGGCLQEASCENRSALTVSAEVLKLNEQIARVRQQLTSLCSTEQINPTSSPGNVEKLRPHTRSLQFNVPASPQQLSQVDNYEALNNRQMGLSYDKNHAGRSMGSPHYRRSFGENEVFAKSLSQETLQPREKPNLDWEDVGHVLIGRSSLQPDNSSPPRDVRLNHSHPVRLAKEKPATRLSARDSLGTSRIRPNVSKKIKMRVPSIASSHSDVVCSHCQKCMTDDEIEEALHHSNHKVYYDPAQDLCHDHSQHRQEPRHWSHSRQTRIDSSTGSEEREAIDHSLHKCRQKSRTHVAFPDPAGRWSDESYESRPARPAPSRQYAAGHSAHSSFHLVPRNPSSKTRGRRVVQQDAKVGRRTHAAKDERQLQKPAGSILRKTGPAGTGMVNKFTRKEKGFPENLREGVHSHHHELSQFRVSTAQPPKFPL